MDCKKIVITTLLFVFGIASLLAQTERGTASYYAKSWTGRKTANGERLHHDSLTCAHKTFPFGTLLKVTNPANGLSVIVKVTDRGPYVKGRVVDLSVRAAKELGILSQGIAPVIVERYSPAIIPFKPEDFELPEFDLGTNEGSDTKPIWMELRDQRNKRQEQEKQNSIADKRYRGFLYRLLVLIRNTVGIHLIKILVKTIETIISCSTVRLGIPPIGRLSP